MIDEMLPGGRGSGSDAVDLAPPDRVGGGRVLALAERRGPDDRELAGTVAEVRNLGRKYRRVDVGTGYRGRGFCRTELWRPPLVVRLASISRRLGGGASH